MLAPTDAAAVFSVLRKLPLPPRLPAQILPALVAGSVLVLLARPACHDTITSWPTCFAARMRTNPMSIPDGQPQESPWAASVSLAQDQDS